MRILWTIIVTGIFSILIMLGGCEHIRPKSGRISNNFGRIHNHRVYFVGLGSQ